LQASGNLKEITFDFLKKFSEREKDFGKNPATQYFDEAVCLKHRENNHAKDSSRVRGGKRGRGKINFRGMGGQRVSRRRF